MQKQNKIRLPDRRAKILRNSPQLSNLLDGNGMGLIDMEKHQLNVMKEEQKEHVIRQTLGTSSVLRALGATRKTQHYNIADDDQSQFDDFQDVISDSITNIEENQEQKLAALRARVANDLDGQRKQDYVGNLTRLQ